MTRSSALVLLSLLFVLPATAQSVTVSIHEPEPGQVVGDTLSIRATTSSTYQLQSITATVADRSTPLTYAPSGYLVGALSLAGLPRGPLQLTVTAQDIYGTTGSRQVTFTHDVPPQLTITSPLNNSVARPLIRLTLSCTDDDPVGCTFRVHNGFRWLFHAASGPSVDTYLSFDFMDPGALYEGGDFPLIISATDSAGQTVTKKLTLFVDSSRRLQELLDVPGVIFDVDATRVLYRDDSGLKIRDRVSGEDTVLTPIAGCDCTASTGKLTPRGAIFIAEVPVSPDRLYELQDGVLLRHSYPFSLSVAGGYAAWVGPAGFEYNSTTYVFLRDLVAGNTTQLPFSGSPETVVDVTEDGAVAFSGAPVASNPPWSVYLYKNGSLEQLTTGTSSIRDHYPRTDGTVTLFTRENTTTQTSDVIRHDGTTETDIGEPSGAGFSPGYDVNNGWIAVSRRGVGGEYQLWRISPGGIEEQLTVFGSSSILEHLAADGELTFFNNSRRYLSKPGVANDHINSSLGRAFPLDGDWFVTIGRSLFSVRPTAPVFTTTTLAVSPAGPVRRGDPVTLTATVTGGAATGVVAFRTNETTVGSAPLNGGMATLTTTNLPQGALQLVAVYGGDADHQSSVSAPQPYDVYGNAESTTVIDFTTPNPSEPGQPVTIRATVKGSLFTSSPVVPTGSITFYSGQTVLGTGTVQASPAYHDSGIASIQTSALTPGPHQIVAVYSGDGQYRPSTSGPHAHVVYTPFGAPTNVTATATSPMQVTVTWTGVSGASFYEVLRAAAGGSYVSLGYTTTAVTDTNVAPDTSYLYKVRAFDSGNNPSPFSEPDEATTVMFTDPLDVVSRQHFVELQTAVNAMRALAVLAPATFPAINAGAAVSAAHVLELRGALDEARAALGLPAIAWTDPALTGVPVKRIHIQELREGCR